MIDRRGDKCRVGVWLPSDFLVPSPVREPVRYLARDTFRIKNILSKTPDMSAFLSFRGRRTAEASQVQQEPAQEFVELVLFVVGPLSDRSPGRRGVGKTQHGDEEGRGRERGRELVSAAGRRAEKPGAASQCCQRERRRQDAGVARSIRPQQPRKGECVTKVRSTK